jgi:hypothetical protein
VRFPDGTTVAVPGVAADREVVIDAHGLVAERAPPPPPMSCALPGRASRGPWAPLVAVLALSLALTRKRGATSRG